MTQEVVLQLFSRKEAQEAQDMEKAQEKATRFSRKEAQKAHEGRGELMEWERAHKRQKEP